MPHVEVALCEPTVVFREEAGSPDLVSRKRRHVVERVEEENRDELGAVSVDAPKDERAPVPRELACAAHRALLDVAGVSLGVPGAGGAAPDARDHLSPSRYCVSQ